MCLSILVEVTWEYIDVNILSRHDSRLVRTQRILPPHFLHKQVSHTVLQCHMQEKPLFPYTDLRHQALLSLGNSVDSTEMR